MSGEKAKYGIGQMIHHRLFDYRGVIIDVDPAFQNSEEWYALMVRNRPQKDQPWYHVLVHETEYTTYVAEQNLEDDCVNEPINHPDLEKYFNHFDSGSYTLKGLRN